MIPTDLSELPDGTVLYWPATPDVDPVVIVRDDAEAAREGYAGPWLVPHINRPGMSSDQLAGHLARSGHDIAAAVPLVRAAIGHDGSHWYVSTACQHGRHGECRLVCKFCPAPCRDPWHQGRQG